MLRPLFLMVIIQLVLLAATARGEWPGDTTGGLPICVSNYVASRPALTTATDGTVFVAWEDHRSSHTITDRDIYIQKLNASGTIQWVADGIPAASAPYSQAAPVLIADGVGGVILVYTNQHLDGDGSSFGAAQRLDPSGNLLWSDNGTPICSVRTSPDVPDYQVIADGSGGAFVMWRELELGETCIEAHVLLQHVTESGLTPWGLMGIDVSGPIACSVTPRLIADGQGGAIVVWNSEDIWAQRIASNGQSLWQPGGVLVCGAWNTQQAPSVATDGNGGAIIVWDDNRFLHYGGIASVFAQRIDASGTASWAADGIPIQAFTGGFDIQLDVASDADGGAVVFRGTNLSSFPGWRAQRLRHDGSAYWAPEGIELAGGSPVLDAVSGAIGHAVIVWQSYDTAPRINAQRIAPDGTPSWAVPVGKPGRAILVNQPYQAFATAEDGAGGMVMSWWQSDPPGIYAQRVRASGALGASFVDTSDQPLLVRRGANRVGYSVKNTYPGAEQFRCDVSGDELLAFVIEDSDDSYKPDDYVQFDLGYEEVVDRDLWVRVDATASPGDTLLIGLTAFASGAPEDKDSCTITVVVTDEIVSIPDNAPRASLGNCYPNPFNPSMTIEFALPDKQHVTLVIYDSAGRRVRTLVDEVAVQGISRISWDGRNDSGSLVASGIYFVRLKSNGDTMTRKIALLK